MYEDMQRDIIKTSDRVSMPHGRNVCLRRDSNHLILLAAAVWV